jgi:tRNA modification GTPase
LLNALLGAERVIVTAVPGTTRDVIEESLDLNGLPAVLWDTAGIHETDEQVESIGVQRSREHLEKADAAIFVVDGSAPLSAEDRALFNEIAAKKRRLLAINKSDLPRDNAVIEELRRLHDPRELVCVSAQRGDGIQDLKVKLREIILDTDAEPSIVITNLRHRSALMRGNEALMHALESLDGNRAAELIAVDLNEASAALAEIIGLVCSDDILERIFMSFCIGK